MQRSHKVHFRKLSKRSILNDKIDDYPVSVTQFHTKQFRQLRNAASVLLSTITLLSSTQSSAAISPNSNISQLDLSDSLPAGGGNIKSPSQILIPMEYVDNVYCMKYIIYNNNYRFGETINDIKNDKDVIKNRYTIYRGIIDTGSPFLIVPSICTYMWGKGCLNRYKSAGIQESAISYGGQEYNTAWRTGNFSFFYQPLISPLYSMFGMNAGALTSLTLSSFQNPNYKLLQRKYQINAPQYPLTFGVVGSEIMLPPGGCFVGLIKNTNKIENQMTSSFLEQLGYSSFEFNTQMGFLKLSKTPLISEPLLSLPPSSSSSSSFYRNTTTTTATTTTTSNNNTSMNTTTTNNSITNKTVIKLIDLRDRSTVPVNHYASLVKELVINGRKVNNNKYDTIYAIFDTGLSGCILTLPLAYDENTLQPIRQVSVTFQSESASELEDEEEYITLKARASHDDVFVVGTSNITWFDNTTTNVNNSNNDNNNSDSMTSIPSTLSSISSTSLYDTANNNNNNTDNDSDSVNSMKNKQKPQVIILGLAFFKNMSLIVDIDTQRLSIQQF